MDLGVSAECDVGDPVVIAGHGGSDAIVTGRIIAKREFAGYWEYVLDEALFTALRTRTGAARRWSGPTGGCSASAHFSCRPSRRAGSRRART